MSDPALDNTLPLQDEHPTVEEITREVWAGLARSPKRLSSKFFYDARGSELFERICEQPEYYLTRTELKIMRECVDDIAQALGPRVLLVEYGSGAGLKTRLLLEHMRDPVGYVPVEISRKALASSVAALAEAFPDIEMLPVCADFTQPFTLPEPRTRQKRNIVYFPGSTLGNFEAHDATALLEQMRCEVGTGGGVLIGLDLKKDPAVLEAAYNDAAGMTEAFTLNMLVRFNRELGADFETAQFCHQSRWNPMAGRIETHLLSKRAQDVHVAGRSFHFDADEAMLVEYSCKYALDEFAKFAGKAGLQVERVWTDADDMFSVQLLGVA